MRPLLISSAILTVLTTVACQRTERYDTSYEVVSETYVHKYGVEVPQEDWSDRGEHGQVITTLKNGVVVTKSYASGVLEGETSYTFPHSDIIEKIEDYSNNQLIRETTYYITGLPRQQLENTAPGEVTLTTWYENGSPKSVEKNSHGTLVKGEYYTPSYQIEGRVLDGEGNRVVRNEYGMIDFYDTIQKGQLATRMSVYADGLPKEIVPYVHGQVEGDKKTFYPGGEPNTVEHWEAGKQQGITTVFQNGEKYGEVSYQNGMKNGVEKHFRDGNTVAEEINWMNDQKHGPSYAYLNNGTQTTWFFQGQEVTKNRYDFLKTRPLN